MIITRFFLNGIIIGRLHFYLLNIIFVMIQVYFNLYDLKHFLCKEIIIRPNKLTGYYFTKI